MPSGSGLQGQPRSTRANSRSAKIRTRPFRTALARRKKVAEYRLKGWVSQADIAREMGVNKSLICRDFKVLDEQFLRESSQDTAKHKALDLRRIEEMFGSLWDQRHNVGTARALILLLERKAKLLGLDAPTQVDITDWRREAKNLGVDPDMLFRDMVNFVGERVGAMPSPPLIDLDPGKPYSFPLDGEAHNYEDAPDLPTGDGLG